MDAAEIGWRRNWVTGEEFARLPDVVNDERLFAETRCHVLRPFCVNGQRIEVGAIVTLPRHDALSLKAARKVEIL